MNVEFDEETKIWYAYVATESVLRVGVGKTERKARESAILVKDRWISPDGKRSFYLGGRRNDVLPKPLVSIACEFLGITSLDV